MSETPYTVLRRTAEGTWLPFAVCRAASAGAAIREMAKEDGAYVALPARSWKPLEVTFETKARVSAAKA